MKPNTVDLTPHEAFCNRAHEIMLAQIIAEQIAEVMAS